MNNDDIKQEIIANIGIVISKALKEQQDEESNANYGADKSEDLITEKKKQVENLRRIRNELEDIFASPY